MANPIFIPLAFAKNGLKSTIQKTRQPGQDAQDMTWNDGSPLITLTPLEDGGKAPKGQDFNGVLNTVTEHNIFVQNGNRFKWDPNVVTEFGGYNKDAIVQSQDGLREYISLIDDNQIDPNSGLFAVWSVYSGQGSVPVATSTTTGVIRVLNTLTSTDVGSALSAAQGKALSDLLDVVLYSPIPFFGVTPPPGFLVLSGQSITSAQYPKLFARYGATLPNLNDGSFIRGTGGNAASVGVPQLDAIQNITGGFTAGLFSPSSGTGTGAFVVTSSSMNDGGGNQGGNKQNLSFDASRVVRTANETRPKNIAFLYIVKAG